ncbi:hypothetical protein V5F77_09555 [Xanthobacter sp. DSM 24535]
MNLWRYVITADNGSAPNFESPATTLAICKPRIRRHAQVGDLVVAFAGGPWGGILMPLSGAARLQENYCFVIIGILKTFNAKNQIRARGLIISISQMVPHLLNKSTIPCIVPLKKKPTFRENTF